jgi:hypothetical protein
LIVLVQDDELDSWLAPRECASIGSSLCRKQATSRDAHSLLQQLDRKPVPFAWPTMRFDVRILTFLAALWLGATSALAAEEPSGCDKFKWLIERERAALTAPDRAKLASGGEQAALPSSAITLALVAPSEARLPSPPERAPKDGTFAGFASFKSAPKAGVYTISLSAGAWVDVVQDGHFLKPARRLQRRDRL